VASVKAPLRSSARSAGKFAGSTAKRTAPQSQWACIRAALRGSKAAGQSLFDHSLHGSAVLRTNGNQNRLGRETANEHRWALYL